MFRMGFTRVHVHIVVEHRKPFSALDSCVCTAQLLVSKQFLYDSLLLLIPEDETVRSLLSGVRHKATTVKLEDSVSRSGTFHKDRSLLSQLVCSVTDSFPFFAV